ncbi:MAG: ribbon-helix-helix domain-containing protein [Geobacteraceae bacterium]|nr:ribbon-helix-helix domain-containing protein [Geobacteraceae bacterium]
MGSMKENPRYNIVSMRISQEEKAELDAVTRLTRKSISSLMRDALELYTHQLGQGNSGCQAEG